MLDMSEIFDDPDIAQEIPLQKNLEVKNADGDLVNKLGDPEPITAIIHPTKPDDVLFLPEGERYNPSKKIFSPSPLNEGDIFLYEGKMWRIRALGNWGDYGFYNGIGILHEGTQEPFAKGFELK